MESGEFKIKHKCVKVMYLCESLRVGGAEQLILTTVKNLDRDKFFPIVCSIREKGRIGREIEDLGITVVSLGIEPNFFNFKLLYKLLKIIKANKPQILHCHLFYANYFGRLAAIITRVTVVIITEHGTYSNFKKFYHHWIDFILSLFTSRIIAVSKAVREYLCKQSLISFRKVNVIYNAVDIDRFDKVYELNKNLMRKRLGSYDSDLLIGCVSTIVPWKGQAILLKAFAKIVEIIPSAKLYIIGRSNHEFEEQLDNFIQDNGLLENVHFLGERRDIPEILKALDIFVFPSLTEGLGISLLEAMYMGIPPIASNIEGITEVIEHGKDGLLFNTGNSRILSDSILRLINDREKALKIGLNAREKIKENFSPSHYIDKLQLLYMQLLEKKNYY